MQDWESDGMKVCMYVCKYVMSRLRGQTYVFSLHCFFCSGLGHQHTKGADGSRYQSIYEPTEPAEKVS